MPRLPAYINVQNSPFNNPGQLFNGPTQPIKHYLTALPPSTPTNPVDLIPDGSRVRLNFDNYVPYVASTLPPPIIRRQALVGNFSGVRAGRVLHQHAVNFWSNSDIQAVLNDPPPITYTPDVLSQMYQDFLLFNYLPPSMTPTEPEFIAIVQPTGDFHDPIGINQAGPPDDTIVNDPLLPPAIPFGESLTPFCQLITVRATRNA